jgi:hypothetical protein
MHPLISILRKSIAPVVTSLLSAASLSAQSKGIIDCTLGGHGPNCEVNLATGQRSVFIHFRPTVSLPAGAPLKYNVQGTHILRQVSLGADNTGQIPWSNPTPPTDTVLILVQTSGVPILQSDTIRIIPAAAPSRSVMPQDNLAPYVWLRNNWVPTPLRIGLATPGGPPLSEKECESLRYSLQAIPEGDVSPDTGSATYEAGARPYNCFVVARWKLADVAGRQDFGVRVGNELVRVHGVAREGPRIVAGLALFTRHVSEQTRYCVNYEQAFNDCHTDRESFADTVKKKRDETGENAWQPFFAVEAPFLWRQQFTNRGLQKLQRHLRLVGGSSFVKPTDNFFLGVTFLPVLGTELESLPIQIETAWRWNGGFVGGLSVDGTGLLTNALKALGAPF